MTLTSIVPGETVQLSAYSTQVQQREFVSPDNVVLRRAIVIDLAPGYYVTETNFVMASDGSGAHTSMEVTMVPVKPLSESDSEEAESDSVYEPGSLCTPTTGPTSQTDITVRPIEESANIQWLRQQAVALSESLGAETHMETETQARCAPDE